MDLDSIYIKKILANFNEITYTEHFLEKIDDRNICDVDVEQKLECENPKHIKKISKSRKNFEICFAHDKDNDFVVVVTFAFPNFLILLSAYFKKTVGCWR